MTFLVTGGAGFIGSNLVRRLLAEGYKVRVLDNLSSGKLDNLTEVINDIEMIEGDIRDYWTVVKAVKGVDFVSHQAALPSVPRSVDNPLTSNAVNIDGTLNVLEAARQAGVKRFVTASSSSVYGESPELPKHEGMVPHPLSPYAITKLTNEYYCRVYWELYRFPTVALRYFNIFGPRQDPNGDYAPVVPKFIFRLLDHRSPIVFGDGEQSRDFTYIDNCVQANLLACREDRLIGGAFNVACGGQFTLNTLITELKKILKIEQPTQFDPARPGDIKHSFAAIGKLQAFGYKPTVSFVDGLKLTAQFFAAQVGKPLPK